MRKFFYTVKDQRGMHARPADKLVRQALEFSCKIRLRVDEKEIDAKQLFPLRQTRIPAGTRLEVVCDGSDEEQAAQAIYLLLQQYL